MVVHSAGAVTTGAATGEQNLATVTIPANYLGVGGKIRINAQFMSNNNVNTKTYTIRFNTTAGAVTGGLLAMTASNTTGTGYSALVTINNTATNAQQVVGPGGTIGANPNSPGAGSIDTTAVTYININGNPVTSASDTVTVVGWTVEVFRGGVTYYGS